MSGTPGVSKFASYSLAPESVYLYTTDVLGLVDSHDFPAWAMRIRSLSQRNSNIFEHAGEKLKIRELYCVNSNVITKLDNDVFVCKYKL